MKTCTIFFQKLFLAGQCEYENLCESEQSYKATVSMSSVESYCIKGMKNLRRSFQVSYGYSDKHIKTTSHLSTFTSGTKRRQNVGLLGKLKRYETFTSVWLEKRALEAAKCIFCAKFNQWNLFCGTCLLYKRRPKVGKADIRQRSRDIKR